jgi:hypothetical protein
MLLWLISQNPKATNKLNQTVAYAFASARILNPDLNEVDK